MPEDKSLNYQINTAFLGVQRRAESVDRATLVQTFVDIGTLFAVLSSHDHQIVYGRRGTGKTHALLYLAERARQERAIPVYVDLRSIGSSGGLYADASIPIPQRATRLLLDVLGSIHEGLLEYVIGAAVDLALIGPALDELASAATEVEVVGETQRETREVDGREEQDSSGSKIGLQLHPAAEISSTVSSRTSSQRETGVAESGVLRYRVHFGNTNTALKGLVNAIRPSRLLFILDEWSAVPLELQPYLADLIRRAVFPIPGVTVKVAAIEQRSNFKMGTHADYTGIEIGADASADVDLDDYMVFDNNAERAVQFFQELIFRHYRSEATTRPDFETSDGLVQAAFTQHNAFEDFVKSAEGVPRDAFNILSIAAQRSLADKISISTIRIAARTWFQRDKEGAIRSNPEAQDLLNWVIDEVIAHRRARAFLLKSNTRHTLIDALFDARLLHVMKRSISAKDEPGARYDAYKLDYGCYVDLLATAKAPTHELFENQPDDEPVGASIKVPTDDYRPGRKERASSQGLGFGMTALRDDSVYRRRKMKRILWQEALRRTVPLGLLAFICVLIWPALANAEVTRVEIAARRDVAAGRSFGSVGPYERLTGKIYFLIDPANKRNQVIADLDKAPKNAAGKIEVSSDLVILEPKDAAKGNGIAIFDIVNRGNGVVLPNFDGPPGKTPESEAGDGFLLNRGYTIVMVGWEFDARREGAVKIDLPGAMGVKGLVRATFIPDKRSTEATVADLVGYMPSDPASPKNTLRVREKLGGSWATIPRDSWKLAGNTVTLLSGFEPGHTYELSYMAENPPVAGLGFAAVRDAAAWVKYAPDAAVTAKYTFAFGVSQTGRWLREFLYEGFNTDESNRQVFDAVWPHRGGAAGVELDVPFATPTSLLMESATHFPFSDRKQRDPVTGLEEGNLENARAAEHQPKIFFTYSDTEYWERSIALATTTPDGSKDIEPLANERLYLLAGSPHNVGAFPPAASTGQLPANPFDPKLVLRALLIGMEKWVQDGTAPPPSRYPRLKDHTLARASEVAWPKLPGVTSPATAYAGVRGPNRLVAKDGAGTPLPYLVPQLDRDGNAVGGLRLPDVAVPLATYTGWNFRNTAIGGTEQFFPLMGSYIPFARTKAEREQARDPRLSVEERYHSRDEYLKLVQEAAAPLVKDGYLLTDDVPAIVKHAGEHWDLLAGQATRSSAR